MFVCIAGTILVAYAFQSLVFIPDTDMGNPLLRSVGSLSGGAAAVIEKQDRNVQVVMDPAGKAMVATYTDLIRGGGGIVFDSGSGRLLNASAEGLDNGRYLLNIADWLEERNPSDEKKRVLLYVLPEGGRQGIGPGPASVLQGAGYSVKVTDRRETAEISSGGLAGYSQVWLFFDGQGSRLLSPAELDAISGFHRGGKGILVVAGGGGDSASLMAANQISSRFGVRFSGSAEHPAVLPANPGSYFFTKASVLLGHILKFMDKA